MFSYCIFQICSKKKMYWYYYQQFPQPYMTITYPVVQVLQHPSSSPSIEKQQIQQKNERTIEADASLQEKLIILTKEDLEEAGYQIDKKLWTQEEDKILLEQMKKKKMNWDQIAKNIPGRNPKMCYNRYRRMQNSTRNCWKTKQNNKILQLVKEYGQDWDRISQALKERSPKQVKQHYFQYLEPSLNKNPWTIEEDLQLIDLINIHGANWKNLSQKFPKRTQIQIKNRYFGKLRKLDEKKRAKQAKPNMGVKIEQF